MQRPVIMLRNFLACDLRTRAGWLKLVALASGFLLAMGAIAVGVVNATSQPEFCGSCHEMQPQYASWQESSHRNVDCIRCHVEPGVGNLIKHKLGAVVQVYEHFTGTYPQPIKLKEELPASICLQCHSSVATGTGSKFPHPPHLQANLNCATCHAGLVHGAAKEKPAKIDCASCHGKGAASGSGG